MNRFPLHHIGIVMTSTDRAEALCEKFGLEIDYKGYAKTYQSDCIMLTRRETETPIELIIPRDGILTQYNNGKGGLHHIAFQVPDVESVRLEYEKAGYTMLEPHAVLGAGNLLVNYLPPRFAEGILVEFVQVLPQNDET